MEIGKYLYKFNYVKDNSNNNIGSNGKKALLLCLDNWKDIDENLCLDKYINLSNN